MNDGYRRGIVFVQNERAGLISETDRGYEFRYEEAYRTKDNAYAVSLTLPLREEPYYSTELFSFFDGLIPEGWLLHEVTRNWKIDAEDRFGLLLCVCQDCIGDVWVKEEVDS